MIQPGIYCGDFDATRIVLIGYIPTESHGYLVRAMNIRLGADWVQDGQSTWTLQIGKVQPAGVFTVLFERSLGTGLKASGTRWLASPGFRVGPGDLIGLRALQLGGPATLEGLSVALEYGILGSR